MMDAMISDGAKALAARARARLTDISGRDASSAAVWFVPGRIEVLGKHTDYAGGRSLLCTVERGVCLAALPREDAVVRLGTRTSAIEARLAPERPAAARSGPAIYVDTVAARLARNFGRLEGIDAAVAADLPQASGLSSSSAFLTAIVLALAHRNQLHTRDAYVANVRSREDLAGYVSAIEGGGAFGTLAGDAGVGTMSGSEDHTAMFCCERGRISQYSFCPVRAEATIALPEPWTFVVGVSGIAAVKTGAARDAYNRAASAAAAVLEMWRAATGRSDLSLAAAATAFPGADDEIRRLLRTGDPPSAFTRDALLERFEQFFEESERIIPKAAAALARGDTAAFGAAVDRSQHNVETRLHNQVPETIALARNARRLGAAAASAFGAGFGGSVWALVREPDAPAFIDAWRASYRREFPHRAASEFFVSRPGGPLRELR
ncbi:MAG TPA: galactokinase family protein [Vicinamibacterales bacterium]|nr:galactokinase family protein [Vicinamibacterales bacterium]